ncbi:hypothetical protein EG329_012801 [Mollisiaceae sp. DMI_Dod_QoI]|nr:hypothetical protein EG329_012801 [Helotiales sp. DMI_Dod_QoI]
MASEGTPNPPAASGINEAPVNDSPPKYVPQFSAATEMILKRIQSGATSSFASTGITGTPAGYEDMKRSVMQSMKTTMNMEIPSTPIGSANRARAGRASAGGSGSRGSATPTAASASGAKGKGGARPKARAGTKRKRAKSEEEEDTEESDSNMSKLGGDSDSDGSGSIPDLPKMTQSGRQVVKPQQFVPASYEPSTKRRAPSRKTQEQALCKRCGRGHSPENNMIVFCDGCNGGWHQQCHDPKVSDEAVQDEKAQWFCADCSRKKGIKPTPEPPKGVSWAGRSSEEKRAYLNSLPHPHLVSLLLQATTLHPNLPIFPATPAAPANAPVQAYFPRTTTPRTNVYPQQPFPPSASTAGLFSRAEANPNAPINFIRKIPPGSSQSPAPTTPASATHSQSQQMFTHASSAPPQLPAQGEDSRESTPASPPYPKAGNGLMAKLGPDEEDLDWLVDNNDFDAFSHVVYDDAGEKVEENGVPVNGASVIA